MAKYSKAAGKKVEAVMKEMKKGSLKSGSGKKVTDKKQAVAIGLSEAKKQGLKVPAKKGATAKKATPAKKAAPAKKATPVKKVAAAKKAAPAKKSAPAKKAAPAKKVASARKAMPTKRSAPVKKAAPAKKATAVKKAVTGKKSAAPKKATPVKTAPAAKKAIAKPATAKTNNQARAQNNKPIPLKNKVEVPAIRESQNMPPVEENSEMLASVEEPTRENPITNEAKGSPIPENQYAIAKDTYHGHVKPTGSKSKIKPSGKKPLWN